MDARDLLIDGIERSREGGHTVLDGLGAATANRRPEGHNSITWLVWHLARQADVQIAHLAVGADVWTRDGWVGRFALDLPADAMGFGQTDDEAARVVVEDVALLRGYLDAVVDAMVAYLRGLDAGALDDVVDDSYDPPVTRGVRLVSIVDDAAQHSGQAAYVRGLVEGWRAAY